MGAAARAESAERARKPRARGSLKVVASILLVRRLRTLVADAGRTIDVAQARVDAINELGASLDRQGLEPHEPWWCSDCERPSKQCTCAVHGWEE